MAIVYKRNYLVRGDDLNRQEDDTIDFDVVTELVCADREAYLAWGAVVGRGGHVRRELSYRVVPDGRVNVEPRTSGP
jgi:hypothetical protein